MLDFNVGRAPAPCKPSAVKVTEPRRVPGLLPQPAALRRVLRGSGQAWACPPRWASCSQPRRLRAPAPASPLPRAAEVGAPPWARLPIAHLGVGTCAQARAVLSLRRGGAHARFSAHRGGLPRPERSSPSRSCSGPSSPWSGARPPSFSGSGSSCGKPDRASTSKSPSSCGCSSSTSGGEAVARLRGGLPRPPQPARGLCENPRLALGLRSRRGPALEISASGLRGADRCAASPSTLTRRARQPPRMP